MSSNNFRFAYVHLKGHGSTPTHLVYVNDYYKTKLVFADGGYYFSQTTSFSINLAGYRAHLNDFRFKNLTLEKLQPYLDELELYLKENPDFARKLKYE